MRKQNGKYEKRTERKPLSAKTKFLLWLNAILLLGVVACFAGLRFVTTVLDTQKAAQSWRGSNEMRFAQVSAFLPVDGPVTEDQIAVFRQTLEQKMLEASLETPENASLYADAYSGLGTVSLSTERASADAVTLGVGGDFFRFHPLELRSGTYFSGADLMHDRVILSEDLAWQLFGSTDVAGLSVMIGERPYPVVGVVRHETDFATKQAYAEDIGLYMSYDAMSALTEAGISSYELVAPDVITGFAASIVEENFPLNGGTVVENSSRYRLSGLLRTVGQFGLRSMNTHGLIYPYWENAARMTEDYAAALLLLLAVLAICPLVCGVIVLIRKIRETAEKLAEEIPARIEERVEKKREKKYVKTGI